MDAWIILASEDFNTMSSSFPQSMVGGRHGEIGWLAEVSVMEKVNGSLMIVYATQ